MRKYDQYKDSGIEWVGEIPEHWADTKVKHVAEVTLGKMLTNEDKGDYVLKPYLRSANIDWFDVNVNDIKEMWFSKNELKKLRLEKGDLLISEGGEVGRTCIWKNEIPECFIQNSVHKIRCGEDLNSTYLMYLMVAYGSRGAFDSIVNRISIAHLTFEKVREIKVLCPSLKEQHYIVKYLDSRRCKIDICISQKQQLIDLLNEEKAAIINHAVTKGIDADTPMKPSGIEWLGDIPAHWKVKKLKYLVDKIDKPTDNSDFVVAVENIESRTGKLIYSEEQKSYQGQLFEFQSGDVLFNKLRPYLAKVFLADKTGAMYGELLILRALQEVDNQFLFFRLLSYDFIQEVNSSTEGTKMPRANWEDFIKHLEIPIPPKEQQREIANNIFLKIEFIDSTISKIQREIELLQEYKTSLIYEVVTGKVKVDPPVEKHIEIAL